MPPSGLELGCPAEAGHSPPLSGTPTSGTSHNQGPARRVSFIWLLGGLLARTPRSEAYNVAARSPSPSAAPSWTVSTVTALASAAFLWKDGGFALRFHCRAYSNDGLGSLLSGLGQLATSTDLASAAPPVVVTQRGHRERYTPDWEQ